jgi:hypothetical protein
MVVFPSSEHHSIPLSRLPQQLRQLGDIRRNPSRLDRMYAGLVLKNFGQFDAPRASRAGGRGRVKASQC